MSQKVVIIGAVALGPKAACRFKRLEPDSQVIMIDENEIISYGGCGIPYYVSGDISDARELQSTTFHMVRDVDFFRDAKDVQVRTRTRALSIDRMAKKVHVHDLENDEKYYLDYDKLVLSTGSSPRKLPLSGVDLPGVYAISGLEEAIRLKDQISQSGVEKAVVVGAGLIGLEMAEALTDLWGIETSVVEIAPQLLPGFVSPDMARMVANVLEENDISLYTGEQVREIFGGDRVRGVRTDQRDLEADMVVMAAGVVPNSNLARESGLEVSPQGAIVVDKQMRTSDADIFAGGDCVQIENLITGKPGYYPMGSMANRQGRVIGTNLAGGSDEFPGAVGSFVVKLFDHAVSGTGLSIETASRQGSDAFSAFVTQFDKSHFYPEKDLLYLEMVVDRSSGRILGLQGLSTGGDSLKGRIDCVAALLPGKPTTKDLSNLEVSYSPPFGSAMDALNNLGNVAENILQGHNMGIGPGEFARLWQERGQRDVVFMDCRGEDNAAPLVEKHPEKWKNVQTETLEANVDQVPRAETVVLVCNNGGRSYEAQLKL
ncbi:FAD-dependent oxidoreductase, partial [Desulfonatronospira sp.]|uniref:FAD-dependent oxidoreductase n=1 Tax=Desulfonatronospira sp. TaxID=1962951 RepID=UPI0025C26853